VDERYVPGDVELRAMLRGARTIAVVGLSSKPWRVSNRVAGYLQSNGYRIVPVNPVETDVLGEEAHPSLLDVPEEIRIDIVDVFRRSEYTPDVAKQAVAIGAQVLWLQIGIINDEARRIAEAGGLKVVMGECIMITHSRLEV
jgi:predicted CoA-binding protein